MFNRDENGNITMHRGDTGAYKVRATRSSGEEWTGDDRMLYTVRDAEGTIVLQRFYRLDTELGNGVCEIQIHNNDTDTWKNGVYNTERRYIVAPRWTGEPPEGDCVDALTAGVRIVDGDVVRVPATGQGTMTLNDIYGEV